MIARMKDTSKYFAIKAVNKSFIQKVISSLGVSFAGRICQGSHGGAECAGRDEPPLYRPVGVFFSGECVMSY